MTYSTNEWPDGSVITGAKLENLETGIQEALAAGFRHGIVSGKTSSGAAAYLQNDTSSISIDASTTDPLVVTFAAGMSAAGVPVDYRKAYLADTASVWASLTASKTLYLYLNHDGTSTVTGGFSTLTPGYGYLPPNSGIYGTDVATSAGVFVDSTSIGVASGIFANDAYTTGWITNTAGASSSGNAYFGCDLGAAYTIGRATFLNGESGGAARYVTSVKLQYSTTGTSGPWTDAQTFTVVGNSNTLTLASPVSARYWRFLANSATNDNQSWQVSEAELIPVDLTDQHWFDLSTFRMKRHNGTAWEEKNRVFVGECTTDGSGNVSTLTPYAIRGIYAPGRISASASTATTKNHNLGCDNVVAMCHQTTSIGGSLTPCALTGLTAKTVSFTTAASVVEVVPVVRRAF